MYYKFVSGIYALNIIIQGLFNLVTPPILFFFIALLSVKKLGAPEWIYVIAIVIGFIIGIICMIKFIIVAMNNLERLDKIQKSEKNNRRNKGNGQ